jgi:hypothetical protein
MDALDVLRYEARRAYAWLETNVSDVTPEQASWRPPGTANSIAATYAHIMIWADVDLTRHFHGREPLLGGEWGRRLSLSEQDPNEFAAEHYWALLREYGREVHRQVVQQVGSVTVADLEREFQMMPESHGTWKGIDVYTLHGGSHVWMHGGEIACLKGLQGAQGYRAPTSPWLYSSDMSAFEVDGGKGS